jgi:hypothetical protein
MGSVEMVLEGLTLSPSLGSIPSNAHGESIVQTNDSILGIVRLRHRR